MIGSFERSQARMQGKLFQLSGDEGYDSEGFIKTFMTSKIAKALDSEFDFLQWAGKEYIFEKIGEELPQALQKGGNVFDGETLYWTGYLYRLWHFYTGESSKAIYHQADARRMNSAFLAYHCMDPEMAIERLKEA